MNLIKDKDSGGFDICQVTQKTVEELYNICQFIPYAEGFNSGGWIKYHISDHLDNAPGGNLFIVDKPVEHPFDSIQLITTYCICESHRFDKIAYMNQLLYYPKFVQSVPDNISDTSLIINSDAIFCEYFPQKIDHLCSLLHTLQNWDIILLGFTPKENKPDFWNNKMPKIKPLDYKLIKNNNMSSYIISRQGIEKMKTKQNLNVFMILPHLIQMPFVEHVVDNLIVAKNDNYKFFLKNLKYNIENSDIKTFKNWECFGKKGLWIYVPDDHIANSKYEENLIITLSTFTLKDLKDPVPTQHTRENLTDPLIVRNAADFARQNINLTKYDHILEIGAGYGALANVLLNSGYTGTYTIYDFELMEKVHRHYIQHPFNFVSDPSKIVHKPNTLMISTWGISEMPTELVEKLLGTEYFYLIAQNMYENRNNVEYFQTKLGILPKRYDDNSVIFLKI